MADFEKAIRLIQANREAFDGLEPTYFNDFIDWLPNNMHVVNAYGRNALFLKKNGNLTPFHFIDFTIKYFELI